MVADCNASGLYWNGWIYAFNATTTPWGVASGKCTEFAFGIDTAKAALNTTYRFRLISGLPATATSTSNNKYIVYPSFTTQTAAEADLKYSRQAFGATSTVAVDGNGFDGGASPDMEIMPTGLSYIIHDNLTK